MSRRTQLLLLAVVLLLAGAWVALGLRDSPEKALRRAIEAFADRTEAEDLAALGAMISPGFDGELVDSRDQLLDGLRRGFDQVEDLDIRIVEVEAHLEADRADALILYRVAGVAVSGGVYSRVPFRSFMSDDPRRPEPVYTEWERSEGIWRLRFVTFEVHDRWDDFPTARRLMGK